MASRVQTTGPTALYHEAVTTGPASLNTSALANLTAGNRVLIQIAHYSSQVGDVISAITVNGAAATLVVRQVQVPNSVNQAEIWECVVPGGTPAKNIQISYSGTGAPDGHYTTYAISEWSGLGALRDTNTGNGNTNSATVSSDSTPVAGDAVFGTWVLADGSAVTVTPPGAPYVVEFNEPSPIPHEGGGAVSGIATSGGIQTTTWGLSAAIQWGAVIAVFAATAPSLGSFFDSSPPPPRAVPRKAPPVNAPWTLSALAASPPPSFVAPSTAPTSRVPRPRPAVVQGPPPGARIPINYATVLAPPSARAKASPPRRPTNQEPLAALPVASTGTPWDSLQSKNTVHYAPASSSSDVFPSLGFAPTTSPTFNDWGSPFVRRSVLSRPPIVADVFPAIGFASTSSWVHECSPPKPRLLSRAVTNDTPLPRLTFPFFDQGAARPTLRAQPLPSNDAILPALQVSALGAFFDHAPSRVVAPVSKTTSFSSDVFPAFVPAAASSFLEQSSGARRPAAPTQPKGWESVPLPSIGFAPSPQFQSWGEPARRLPVKPVRLESQDALPAFVPPPAPGQFIDFALPPSRSRYQRAREAIRADVFPSLGFAPPLLPFFQGFASPSPAPVRSSVPDPTVLPALPVAFTWVPDSLPAVSRWRSSLVPTSDSILPALPGSSWLPEQPPAVSRWHRAPPRFDDPSIPPALQASLWIPESTQLPSWRPVIRPSAPLGEFLPAFVPLELSWFPLAPPPAPSPYVPAQPLASFTEFLPPALPLPDVSGVRLPFLPSSNRFYSPRFFRRAEEMLAMLPPGTTAPLFYVGSNQRYVLTPLLWRDARTEALLRLRHFLSLVTFRREAGPGEEDGIAFRLPLDQIHEEMPDDILELQPPAIGFLPIPGPGIHDSLGLGGLEVLEETQDLYGPGTVVVRYGDWIEYLTLEVIAEKKAHRRGLVAGLQQILRLSAESDTLRLTVPALFGAIAEFNLTDTQYIDDPYVVQNRRRAHLHVTLTVPEVFLARSYPQLRPQVSVLVDVASVDSVPVLQQLDPTLPPDLVALLVKKP